MLNKAARILIADEDLFKRIEIEKFLNQLGCYCIAPMSSLSEVESVVQAHGVTFDLLIINSALTRPKDANLLEFFSKYSKIRQALIYNNNTCNLMAYERPEPQTENPQRINSRMLMRFFSFNLNRYRAERPAW